jgi:hypothetical protein
LITVLNQILCWIAAAAQGVLWALASAVNLIVSGLGAFIAAVVGLLPSLPAVPELPGGDAPGWVAWLLPVTGIAAALAGLVTTYVAFLVIRIALRWVKAL